MYSYTYDVFLYLYVSNKVGKSLLPQLWIYSSHGDNNLLALTLTDMNGGLPNLSVFIGGLLFV